MLIFYDNMVTMLYNFLKKLSVKFTIDVSDYIVTVCKCNEPKTNVTSYWRISDKSREKWDCLYMTMSDDDIAECKSATFEKIIFFWLFLVNCVCCVIRYVNFRDKYLNGVS